MMLAGEDGNRILVLAPRGRDAFAIAKVLTRSRVSTVTFEDLSALVVALNDGAGAVLLTEEALAGTGVGALFEWLGDQPPWSDMPIILLSTKRVGKRPDGAAVLVERLGNVVLLERPIHAETLTGAARAALRVRGRQYQARAHLFERDEAQRRLRVANETLESRVEERTRELMVAEETMRHSQKLEAVGQLTGGVAHDFNNLLTIIRSSVDLLRRPDLPEERRRRYVDAVSDTVDRAAKLTSQLLAFARRQALKPEVFDAGARLREVAEMLDTVTGARVNVVTNIPDEPRFVLADLSQFETALVNMAVNARDAMNGEGDLTLSLHGLSTLPAIRGHASQPGRFVSIRLSDTGSGISGDQLVRIFEPFYTTKGVGKGTGLGLSQVFGFAKQSSGDVNVTSEVGKGTTFVLYLPEVDRPQGGDVEDGRGAGFTPGGGGRRVLLVEDNVEVRRSSTQVLQDLGYETTWAGNAEEALDKLGDSGANYDVVFSDVVMPGMGGIELAKELRRRMPDLPVVLASGYSDVLAEEGPQGFELLQKPYSAEQVSKALRRATRWARRGRVEDNNKAQDHNLLPATPAVDSTPR